MKAARRADGGHLAAAAADARRRQPHRLSRCLPLLAARSLARCLGLACPALCCRSLTSLRCRVLAFLCRACRCAAAALGSLLLLPCCHRCWLLRLRPCLRLCLLPVPRRILGPAPLPHRRPKLRPAPQRIQLSSWHRGVHGAWALLPKHRTGQPGSSAARAHVYGWRSVTAALFRLSGGWYLAGQQGRGAATASAIFGCRLRPQCELQPSTGGGAHAAAPRRSQRTQHSRARTSS